MFVSEDGIQSHFKGKADGSDARRDELLSLFALKGQDTSQYFSTLRSLPAFTAADLELLLPRASLPQMVDGSIRFMTRDFWSKDDNAVVESKMHTESASAAANFLDLVEEIEKADPDFLRRYAANISESAKTDYAILLHGMGERDDLRDLYLQNLRDKDSFFLSIGNAKNNYRQNEYYPFDPYIRQMARDLASSYVYQNIMALKEEGKLIPAEKMEPFLTIARDYPMESKVIEAINLNVDLPDGLRQVHYAGCRKLEETLLTSPDSSLLLLKGREQFDDLDEDQMMMIGQHYLDLLAHSYGVHPPPMLCRPQDLGIEDSDVDGSHRIWDINNKEECFAHPMGRIIFDPSKRPPNYESFIETMSHEFTHGLEDLALFLNNADFQDYLKNHREEQGLRVGGDDTIQKLKAAGMLISFNTASGRRAEQQGGFGFVSTSGDYYPSKARDGVDEEIRNAVEKKYVNQLRERHAFGFQGFIASSLTTSLDMTSIANDPLNSVMRAQLAMSPVQTFLEQHILPAVSADKVELYRTGLETVDAEFRLADAREAGYGGRVEHFWKGFASAEKVIIRAMKDEFIGRDDKKALAMWDQIDDVRDLLLHTRVLMNFKDRQVAVSATELEQAPA